jgi:hypothetical protein
LLIRPSGVDEENKSLSRIFGHRQFSRLPNSLFASSGDTHSSIERLRIDLNQGKNRQLPASEAAVTSPLGRNVFLAVDRHSCRRLGRSEMGREEPSEPGIKRQIVAAENEKRGIAARVPVYDLYHCRTADRGNCRITSPACDLVQSMWLPERTHPTEQARWYGARYVSA